MLYIYDKKNRVLLPSEETDFKSHEIMERKDIEKWVSEQPEVLGEALFIIANEYDKFDKTKERLDLLALDKDGKLVIVELKREESGKTMELQAIKYAAYCSTLTMDDLVSIRGEFVAKNNKQQTNDEIKQEMFDFIENDDFEALDNRPRIMLAAKDFKPEVTSSVLWLRKFGVNISCIKLTPYKIDEDRIGLVSSVLIPSPEVEEYIIKSERKESSERTPTRTQEEYTDFFKELIKGVRDKIPVSLPEPRPQGGYYQIPTGISSVHFEWMFHGRPRSSFGVELHFEKGNKESNITMLKEMEKLRPEIEKETQETVVFQENWRKSWARLYIEKNEGKITKELETWAVEKTPILYRLLQPKLDKLK